MVNLTWQLPINLQSCLSYLRIRICKKLYEEEIESATEKVTTGEVEDYVVRIIKNIIPTTELKTYVDLIPLIGKNNTNELLPLLKNLKIEDNKFSINISRIPEIVAVNNLHDASFIGLRLGHEDTTNITPANPIIITMKSNRILEQLDFQIIDIDGGDRIKVQGFYQGKIIVPTIQYLTDNFYHQFNIEECEVFSSEFSDAGYDGLAPSSLDMAINVTFNEIIDSVKLTYTDDGLKSSGTFTIGKISCRKYNYNEPIIENFKSIELNKIEKVTWKIKENKNLESSTLQRSVDNISFENIYTKTLSNDTLFTFLDNTVAENVNYYFYRIKNQQIDKHISYSTSYRIKRNQSNSTKGFKTDNSNFTTKINIILLKNMSNSIIVNMYDYNGINIKHWNFENKKQNEILKLPNLDILLNNIYYLEMINNNQKYIVQVGKGITINK